MVLFSPIFTFFAILDVLYSPAFLRLKRHSILIILYPSSNTTMLQIYSIYKEKSSGFNVKDKIPQNSAVAPTSCLKHIRADIDFKVEDIGQQLHHMRCVLKILVSSSVCARCT
jgi:hypothetical protein